MQSAEIARRYLAHFEARGHAIVPSASLVADAQSRTDASAESTGAAEVSATRSWLSWLVISGQPWFSSPTSEEAGTRTDE